MSKQKFLNNLKMPLVLAAAALGLVAVPAAANEGVTTITVGNQFGVSAVGDRTDGYATALDTGQNIDQASQPARFQGASVCLVLPDSSWSLRRDGTLDPRRPAPICSTIANGQAVIRVSGRLPEGSTFIVRYANGTFDWAGEDRVRVTTT